MWKTKALKFDRSEGGIASPITSRGIRVQRGHDADRCDLRDIPMGSADTLKPTRNLCQTDLNCERCQAEGSVQYRVSSDTSDGWIFVCPACWPQFRQQEGYRYGGTRKANRRRRKR